MRFIVGSLAGAVLMSAGFLPTQAGEKDLAVKGEIKIGSHLHKMDAGKLYQIKVEGDGFRPNVMLRPGSLYHPLDSSRGDTFMSYFVPRETMAYRIYVTPYIDDDLAEGPLEYKVAVTNIGLEEKPLLKEESKLTADDPVYVNKDQGFKKDTYHKAFPVKLKANHIYLIDMVKGANTIDPYLYLEDSDMKIVVSDDDGGGNLNSRIFFQPRRNGDFRIIATTLFRATGPFTLTVRAAKKE